MGMKKDGMADQRKTEYRESLVRKILNTLSVMMDLFYVSMLWLLFSLPLITLGASCCALYDTVVHCIREEEEGITYRFVKTFCRCFWGAEAGLLVWGCLCLIGLTGFILIPMIRIRGVGFLLTVNSFLLSFVSFGALLWLFPMASRFRISTGKLLSCSLRISMGNIPATALMELLAAAAIGVSCWLLIPVLILPGVVALIQSSLMEKKLEELITPDADVNDTRK